VSTTPGEVVLEFAGDEVETIDVTVTHESDTVVSGSPRLDGQVVTVPIDDAGTGIYTVNWEIRTADGHAKSGSYFFAVGEGVLDRDTIIQSYVDDGGGSDGGQTTFLEAVAKGLLLISIILLIGAPVAFGLVVFPVFDEYLIEDELAERRARTLLFVAGLLFVGSVGLLGLVRGSFSIGGIEEYASTSLGLLWIRQLLLATVVAAILGDAYRRETLPQVYWLSVAFAGGILGSLSVSMTSHSASFVNAIDGALIDLLHIAAGALWAGGLLVLATAVPPVLRTAHERARRPVAAAIIWRFSIVIVAVITMAVSTGLTLASWHVPDTQSLLATLYGSALSSKLMLVTMALGLGGFARFYLLRRLRPGTKPLLASTNLFGPPEQNVRHDGGERTDPLDLFVRAVRLESGVLLTVILISGLITSAPTAAVATDGSVDDRTTIERQLDDGTILEIGLTPVDDSGSTLATKADTSIVVDATIRSGGRRIPIDDGSSIRADVTNQRTDNTVGAAMEPNDVGGYSTILQLSDSGSWELLVTTTIDGRYIAQSVQLDVRGADGSSDGSEEENSPASGFTAFLSIGALGISLVGMGAVMVEVVRFETEEDEAVES
jgi:copper transport protein